MYTQPVTKKRRTDSAYVARHQRIYQARGRAVEYFCVKCRSRADDWAQVHGTTGEDPFDYHPMCTSCHMRYDKGVPDGKCGNGHVLTEANTYYVPGTRKLQCRDCTRGRKQQWLETHREEHNVRQQQRRGTKSPCPPGCSCWRHGNNNGAAEKARAALLENYQRSNQEIGEAIGVSMVTVWNARKKLEEVGEIGQFKAPRGRPPVRKGRSNE